MFFLYDPPARVCICTRLNKVCRANLTPAASFFFPLFVLRKCFIWRKIESMFNIRVSRGCEKLLILRVVKFEVVIEIKVIGKDQSK